MRVLALLALWLICMLLCIYAAGRTLFAIITGKAGRAWTIIKSYDRLGNAVFNGKDTEFITERAWRGTKEGNRGWCLLCKLLDKIDKNHCPNSEVDSSQSGK